MTAAVNIDSPAPQKLLTPAGFANLASGGLWKLAPHLHLINNWLVDAAFGRRRRIILNVPPRYGKSTLVSHFFPAWYLGVFPERKVLLTGYEADFAAEWGAKAQEVMRQFGPQTFGVELDPRTTAASRWFVRRIGKKGVPIIEPGGMQTAGAGGPLTGKGGHILIIDDPIKNSDDANSETERNKLWRWFVTTARTRLEAGGAIILIMTRWHHDDLAGRLIEWGKKGIERWDVLNIQALAEEGDVLGRAPGEPLWPELGVGFRKEDLEVTRELDPYEFSAQYQGDPTPRSGGMFQRSWFERNVTDGFPYFEIEEYCRNWDLAASEDKGDWTVGALMGRSASGAYYLIDVERFRLSVGRRNERIKEVTLRDRDHYGDVKVRFEEEPGSGGKAQSASLVLLLPGFDVAVHRTTGSKEANAKPFASQVEYDHVKFLRGDHIEAMISEFCSFPKGKHDDIVDACSGAFNELALVPTSSGDCLVADPRDAF